ncbi:MAG: O-methyltransferase [Erysipelotrichaceae bacterium]
MKDIKTIKEYANANDVPVMLDEGLEYMLTYIKEHNIKNILEVGSAIGYSAIQMASLDPNIHVYTIEKDIERYTLAVENIANMELTKQITIVNEDALNSVVEGSYDLIFIDAAKAQYIKFFERYSGLLSEGGVIISDNLAFHGFVEHTETITSRNLRQLVRKIKTYITYLENNQEFNTEFLAIGDGIAITKKK